MSETATASDIERQRAEIIAAMQQGAGVEPMTGEMRAGDVVHAGTDELDVQMVVGKGKNAPIVYIWDTRTGEQSRTNANMLPTQMAKRRTDGSQVFSTVDPNITPVRGTLKCLLHPDAPDRKAYDAWGLAICTKDNLPSRQDVKTHMKNRHKREWETIEEERLRLETDENRQVQRETIEQNRAALQALLAGREAPEYAPAIHTRRRRESEPA